MKSVRKFLALFLALLIVSPLISASAVNDDPYYRGNVNSRLADNAVSENFVHNPRYLVGYDISDMIDVSEHNGAINWPAVRLSGISNVIIRASYRGYSTGGIVTDTRFMSNITGALAAGMNVGVYFYSQAISRAEAISEADYILAQIDGYNLTLPVVFDVEYASSSGRATGRLYNAHLSKAAMADICLAFCDRVASAGYDAMVYSNKTMLETGIDTSNIASQYGIWVAHYAEQTDYSGEYMAWQYSSTGIVAGISGSVDKNYLYLRQGTSLVEPLKLTVGSLSVGVGQTDKVNFFVDSALAPTAQIMFQSSNPQVLTVDTAGNIIGVSVGNAVVSATVRVPDSMSATGYKEYTKSLSLTVTSEPVVIDTNPQTNPGTASLTPWINLLTTLVKYAAQLIKLLVSLFQSIPR